MSSSSKKPLFIVGAVACIPCGLTCVGVGGWLMHRSLMYDTAAAKITTIKTDGDGMILDLEFTPKGKDLVKTSMRIPTRKECTYVAGNTIDIRYDYFKPDDVRFEANIGLLVGSTFTIFFGVLFLIAGAVFIILAVKSGKKTAKGEGKDFSDISSNDQQVA